MKISVIITTVLVAQVSASFFDVFHGAVLSVQNSFGKLLSDVVTDVKDTVDCTILAVEHVLSLSHDATTRYYDKCGNNKTDSVSETRHDASVPKVEVTLNLPNNEEYLQKVIPAEIDARINETLSKVLGNYKPHDDVLSIEKVLAKESEQLAGVSDLVKKELAKLSNGVTTDLKNIEKQRDSQPSVDAILQEIKILENRERNTKNTSEANEIHQIIDQVLGKLNALEATEANENVKLEEILKELENNSNNSFVGLRHRFEEWKEEEARHLSEIKSKIEEHEKIRSDHHHGSYNRHESNQAQPISFSTVLNRDDIDSISSSLEISSRNTTLVKDKLENYKSFRTIGNSFDKSLTSVATESSSATNKTLEVRELNDTVITLSSCSTTDNPIESEIIHPTENPTAVESSELSNLFTNRFTTQNNTTIDDPNTNITNSTLMITDSATLNVTVQTLSTTMKSDKQQSMSTNEPTSSLSTDENNYNQTGIMSNSIPTVEITAINNVTFAANSKIDSGKKESPDSATNNDTIIRSAVETAVTEMTSTTENNNNLNNTEISNGTANAVFENTSVNATSAGNVESSTLATNQLATILSTMDGIESNDTLITSTSSSMNFSTSVMVTILFNESSTIFGNEQASTVATKEEVNPSDFNDTKPANTILPIIDNTPVSEFIQPIENTTASSKEESTTTIVHDNNSIATIISNIPIIDSSTESNPEETTKIVSDNNPNNNMITSDISSIVENTSVSKAIEIEEITRAAGKEESLIDSNETILTSTSLPTVKSTLGVTIQPYETSTRLTSTELTNTSKIEIENDSDTIVTSTPTAIIITSEGESIQAIDTTTVSSREEESLDSAATGTPNATDDIHDDSSVTVVTSTTEAISENKSVENVATSENGEILTSTTNSTIASTATLIDTDSDTDSITRTPIPVPEITTVSEVMDLVESTRLIENKEPSISSITENRDSAVVTENIQIVETASEEQDLSSMSTQSSINEIVTETSITFPLTEGISINENIVASESEEDLRVSPTLETNTFSRTPNIPDLNHVKRNPSLTITRNPSMHREWLTPNKFNQQNYNTNGAPGNNDEFKAPISLSDRLLQTRQPLFNPEIPNKMPMYGQAVVPPITRGMSKDKQLEAEPFAYFDANDERLSHSGSPFSEDIPIANIPLKPLLTNPPRKPIDPRRITFENPSFVPPFYPIHPPFPFDDRTSGNIYRPQGLTTQIPRISRPRANNYKSPSMDYDSFFHMPPRNSEAHQRALKEALQLMANSKRSDRIINNIMKNKNKFNARSIFNR